MAQVAADLDVPPARSAFCWRLLSGPDPERGAETLEEHVGRLGARPMGGPLLIAELEASGLRGRGGAAFPTARKWASVAGAGGTPTVVLNLAEGEPASFKDRTLASMRPHLLLDGAALAAETVGANQVVLYVGQPHREARQAIRNAIKERSRARYREVPFRLVEAPDKYVAGETSALVHRINGGAALPMLTPPRPHEVGVDGRPTLINNAETLAHVALIARYGAGWFRQVGTSASPGTALLTLLGAVGRPGVIEIDRSVTIADVVGAAGGVTAPVQAILLGGYFGTWLTAANAWGLTLDDQSLASRKSSLGCGVVVLLPETSCGVLESALVLRYLANESAGQCGPCVFGLASLAQTMERIAVGSGNQDDTRWLRRWAAQVEGRGACHHPDGAVRLLASALTTFEADLNRHLETGPCAGVHRDSILFSHGGRPR